MILGTKRKFVIHNWLTNKKKAKNGMHSHPSYRDPPATLYLSLAYPEARERNWKLRVRYVDSRRSCYWNEVFPRHRLQQRARLSPNSIEPPLRQLLHPLLPFYYLPINQMLPVLQWICK